jgi:Protein of unknown function (DUF1353)
MKLPALAFGLTFLILSASVVNRPAPAQAHQDKQANYDHLLRLEAQLKQLEQQSSSIKVKVNADNESSGNIVITGEREIPDPTKMITHTSGDANTSTEKDKKGKEKTVTEETVLNIDLSTLNIPDEYIDQQIKAVFSETRTTCGTIPAVDVRQVGVSVNYEVVNDYVYDSGAYRITAFKGFIYDRSSIPRFFWVIVDKDSLGNVAPLFHDLLYRNGGVLPQHLISPHRRFSRREADDLFLEVMTKCGVGRLRRELAYQAVRQFGWIAWKENRNGIIQVR